MSASNPEIKDRSYGIIPIRLTPSSATSTSPPTPTNTQILLIHQKIVDPTNPYFWTFPKGHAEEGDENERGSAVRELWEETGLRVEMEDFVSLKDENGKEIEFRENYRVMLKGEEVGKEVRYWVALVRGEQELKVQEAEVAGAEWVGWDEAERRLSFESGKAMVRRAREGLGREG